MSFEYDKSFDEKWNKKWEENNTYKFDKDSDKEKIYLLEMFSYPSGSKLHLGHWWNYSLPDSWGRMKRMQGYNVFHPMGFDAFGLPAENYAIKTGIHPKDSTEANIKTMEQQLRGIGATYDWDYEIKTCEPEYYKWTQWIFLQLYHKGLAYRKEAPVNWCPNCKTVLANEQASGGVCERCGSEVEQKPMTQWFLKITEYADELIEGLDKIDWPEKTKTIQRNWIGKSKGAEITFDVVGRDEQITVFTTRPDTLNGLSYVVLAPENKLVDVLVTEDNKEAVREYQRQAALLTEIDRQSTVKEKTGVPTGAYAINPLNGEEVPIWVSDYVIASYGTGAVMAVPGHDDRDYEFATKFGLPIKQVITAKKDELSDLPYCEKNGYLVNSGKYTDMTVAQAADAIVSDLQEMNHGTSKINYRLRDWLVSRQRYWGAPIPVIYCDKCGTVPVPEKDLPVELPYNVQFKPDGKSPLAYCEEFVNTTCPCCGGPAKRETDTLDTFVCSSWYQLRYTDPKNAKEPWNKDTAMKIAPVDKYVGGIEHAAMHLMYARFVYKALRDMGYVDGDEPYMSLIHQGTILGADGQKMSKSKGNTVSPDEYIEEYGSDVFRTYLAFGFDYRLGGPWSDSGINAISSYFKKVANMLDAFDGLEKKTGDYKEDEELEVVRHKTIKDVTRMLDNFQFNTAVAKMMEFRTAIANYQKGKNRSSEYEKAVLVDFVKLLAPLAPHYMEEVWSRFGNTDSIFNVKWPEFDEAKTISKEIEVAVQINGKIKARIMIPANAEKDVMIDIAKSNETIAKELEGKNIIKEIAVPNKLVNIVAK